MEAPIEVLRIDQNTVSKELSRFRPCDTETRSFYCRDWAQYIYKKHFIWSAKTQEDVNTESSIMYAGIYQVHFHDSVSKPKANTVTKPFAESNDILSMLDACQTWTTLPSSYSGLPELFEQVEFNPFPENIPLVDDTKDPSHMLDPLIIERQALCLPSDGFYLLKNLTSDILLSHSQPTCEHTKLTSKTHSDLEMDRAIFNENASIHVKKALVEVNAVLQDAWHPLNLFITQLKQHITERNDLIGETGCQKAMDQFFQNQQYQSFVDYWAEQQPLFKKKKHLTKEEVEKLDKTVLQHFEELKQKVGEFITVFMKEYLEKISDLTNELWKLIADTIDNMNQRVNALECLKEIQTKGEKVIDTNTSSLDKLTSTAKNPFNALENQTKIIPDLQKRVEEYFKEIDQVTATYLESHNHIDKLNNKEFKKRVKKLESGYYSIRQHFRYEVTTNLFPESLFCKFVTVCLESMMKEGELMEGVVLQRKVKQFIETHQDLLVQRHQLLQRFEEGVQTGRRELAGILGKLFLKEGMRIQGETLALKRQNNLLKSMGVAVEEEPVSKKKKKKKAAAASAATTTTATSTSNTTTTTITTTTTTTTTTTANNTTNTKVASESNSSIPSIPAAATSNDAATVPAPEKSTPKEQKKEQDLVKEEEEEEEPLKQTVISKKKDILVEKVKKSAVQPAVTKAKEVNSIEEWKNKNAQTKGSDFLSDDWNTVPIKQQASPDPIKHVSTPSKAPPKKETWPSVSSPSPKVPEWPSIGSTPQKVPEVQDWSALRSEIKQTESNNNWASLANAPTEVEASVKKVKKTKQEEWPSIGPSVKSSASPVTSGWSNIANKATTPPTSIPESPAKPVVKESVSKTEEWPAMNPSAQVKPIVTENKWSSIATKTAASSNKSAESGWSSPTKQEPANNGWSSQSTGSSWDTPAKQEPAASSWDAPPKQELVTSSWDTPTATQPATSSWDSPAKQEPSTSSWDTPATQTATSSWDSPAKQEPAKSSWDTPTTQPTTSSWDTPATTQPTKSSWDSPAKQEPTKSSWDSPAKQEPTKSSWDSPSKQEPANNGWSTAQPAELGWGTPAKQESASNDWSTTTKRTTTHQEMKANGTTQPVANAGPIVDFSTLVASSAEPTKQDTWANKTTETVESGWSSPSAAEKNTWTNKTVETTESVKENWTNKATETANNGWSTSAPDNWSNKLSESSTGWSSPTKNTTWSKTSTTTVSENASNGWSTKNTELNNEWSAETMDNVTWRKKDKTIETQSWRSTTPAGSSDWGGKSKTNNRWATKNDSSENLGGWGSMSSGGWDSKKNNDWDKPTWEKKAEVPASWDPTSDWENRANSDNWRKTTPKEEESTESEIPWNNVQTPPPGIPKENTINRPPGLSIAGLETEPPAVAPITDPSSAMLSAAQLQVPLPNNLDELGSDNLILLARNLHHQNNQLTQTVYSMQQEILMMTRRYSDIITLTREKEQQTLQLLEARRQTEIEEARRYVLSLEARIQQFENQSRQQQQRRKKYHTLRCGNCGQEGHASHDCTGLCRYCGNPDHVVDDCPNNK